MRLKPDAIKSSHLFGFFEPRPFKSGALVSIWAKMIDTAEIKPRRFGLIKIPSDDFHI